MPATPYRSLSFTNASLNQSKLNQMANNDQWLFENGVRARYNYMNGAILRDTGLKIIFGKSQYTAHPVDEAGNIYVYFGSFFNVACKPSVSATVETTGGRLRKFVSIHGLGGEIDYRGFIAHISTHERHVAGNIEAGGWIHWQAAGW